MSFLRVVLEENIHSVRCFHISLNVSSEILPLLSAISQERSKETPNFNDTFLGFTLRVFVFRRIGARPRSYRDTLLCIIFKIYCYYNSISWH